MRFARGAVIGAIVALLTAPNWTLAWIVLLLSIAYTILNDEIHRKIAKTEFFISIQRANAQRGTYYGDREN